LLEIRGLTKHYGAVTALDGATLTARSGRLLGFLGPNGAGKTTTMRCVFGLATPDAGEVRWAGGRIDAATRLRFGHMPEQRGLYPRMRVADQLVYGIIPMFIGIFTYSSWVLTGVVEVVLSTVRPRDLLVGKVLGIGTLAIGQLAVLVGVGLVVSQVSGRVTLPATTAWAVVQLVLWFVLGFLFYATAMGALGSLASRPEEASNAAMPVTMSATVAYRASIIFVVQDPGARSRAS
jgi:ABC-type Fe3+/spermidine/putrescine transport system ATPase subunit